MKISRSRFLEVRGVRAHVREWGAAGAPRLYLLHGWMDASPSFQFVVDAFARDWHVIAPDWRGFGRSGGSGSDTYWFPDYFADLDVLLRSIEGDDDAPVRLAGHSMGGNVALMYAGIRPRRVARVAALDAFGMADRKPEEAPGRYRKWLGEIRQGPQPGISADVDALAARLRRVNPRLSAERADWLAANMAIADEGGVRIAGDRAHRRVNPVLYRRAEAEACWRQVRAEVLLVEAADGALRQRLEIDDAAHAAALACFRALTHVVIGDCGHNLHHDQPERLAAILDDFFWPNPATNPL